MLKRSLAASAVLVLLAGCGTDATGQPSAAASPKQDAKQRIEAAKADCLKGKGFTYIPYVDQLSMSDDARKAFFEGDYQALKTRRSKYGFEVFARFVYPEEMGSPEVKPDNAPVNPNFAIRNDLSAAQQKSYDRASRGCEGQAITQVTGKVVKSFEDRAEQVNALIAQTQARELDGDPQIVELASAMADCMTGKGYQIASTKPTDMSVWGGKKFEAEKTEIAKRDDIPDDDLPKGQYFEPSHLAPAVARRYLDREIKVALDDLECGRGFYAAYVPKAHTLERQVSEQFGQ
ncbi:hypothetical protein ABZ297_06205 [Nonomuraea sp. NPDC005983]|uniref:hypothetical protein n=1 Tax=Nonomuraea sp. NPDC005983 TaxID=3155595 RepID=UPI0033B12ED9